MGGSHGGSFGIHIMGDYWGVKMTAWGTGRPKMVLRSSGMTFWERRRSGWHRRLRSPLPRKWLRTTKIDPPFLLFLPQYFRPCFRLREMNVA